MKINNTPVRTSRNYRINNIWLKNFKMPDKINEFTNVQIKNDSSEISLSNNLSNFDLVYGLEKSLENQVKNGSNAKYKISINGKTDKTIEINFKLDQNNPELVENIEIIAEKESKSNIIIKYESEELEKFFHNGIIRILAKENSNLNITIVNFINKNSNNLLAMENNLKKNAKLNYTIVDFGGENSITNYYTNLEGESSENTLNTIYIGGKNKVLDLNYIAHLNGEKSSVNIDVHGALTENAKKNFKGTIDFKKGCKKAKGDENESCMLLSDKAKSLALPMLLCSEDDVEGNHSTSSGKIEEKELFYIMSRGFEKKDAIKLLIKANFNKTIQTINNNEIKKQISNKIDEEIY